MKPFVYGLYDPLEPMHIRYVGQATREWRPDAHAKEARNPGCAARNTHKLAWIRKLRRRNPDAFDINSLPEARLERSQASGV